MTPCPTRRGHPRRPALALVAAAAMAFATPVLAGCSGDSGSPQAGSSSTGSGSRTGTTSPTGSGSPGVSTTATTSAAGATLAGRTTSGATTTGPGGTASTTPGDGSGASAPGVTPTSGKPVLPDGATKANAACRQMYATYTEAVTAWNNANTTDNRVELQAAALALSKAADTMPTSAAASGDTKLVSLTGAVAEQLKRVVGDYTNDRDVDGAALNTAAGSLWTYCQGTR